MKTFPISACLAMLALVPVAAFALGTEVVPIDAWSLTAFNSQRIAPKLIDGSGLSNGGHSTDANGMCEWSISDVSLPEGMGWHVAYAPGTISVEVPSPGSVILLR